MTLIDPFEDPNRRPDATNAEGHPARTPAGVLAVGGSAGCLPPLRELVGAIPSDTSAAVVVTTHVGAQRRSQLAKILDRSGPLPADFPEDGELVEGGRIYIAPPGRHLLIASGEVRLSNGPRVNRHRPSIDVMFASVANWARRHCIAIVLSGVLDDGAVGAAMVARAGGRVFAQDPREAGFPSMPEAVLAAAPGTRPLGHGNLAETIHAALADVNIAQASPMRAAAGSETLMSMADSDNPAFLADDESRLTRITCPECGGAMAQVDLPQISYFRCHVGHQYAPQTLAAAQAEASEAKLWSAVAALEEQAAVQRYLGKVSADDGDGDLKVDQDSHAGEIARRAAALRDQVRLWTAERDRVQPPS